MFRGLGSWEPGGAGDAGDADAGDGRPQMGWLDNVVPPESRVCRLLSAGVIETDAINLWYEECI